MDTITIDEFRKAEILIGKVLDCEKVEGADKLLKLEVDFGLSTGSGSSRIIRQIVSGIAEWYKPEDLIGKKLPFVVNLEPRTFKGTESQGMLLASEGIDGPVLLEPSKDVPEGSQIV